MGNWYTLTIGKSVAECGTRLLFPTQAALTTPFDSCASRIARGHVARRTISRPEDFQADAAAVDEDGAVRPQVE